MEARSFLGLPWPHSPSTGERLRQGATGCTASAGVHTRGRAEPGSWPAKGLSLTAGRQPHTEGGAELAGEDSVRKRPRSRARGVREVPEKQDAEAQVVSWQNHRLDAVRGQT